MFKWKVYFYQNINGKEQKIEKEFNNPNEYYNFINSNEEFNLFTSNNLFNLDKYLENFFNSRFALEPAYVSNNTSNLLPEGVDLDKYEEEAIKIDKEKEIKKEEKNLLEKTLEKLKWYLEKFKKEWRENLVSKVKEDIKKVEEKLQKI